MRKVNILVTINLSDENLQQITDVSPNIELTVAADLLRNERNGDISSKQKLDTLLAQAEVIFGHMFPQNLISRAPRLKWAQVISAGVERYLDAAMLDSSVILTNARGISAIPISEYVLGIMLIFVKQIPLCCDLKREKKWKRIMDVSVLRSKTVGIVGLGGIGRETARLVKSFGMRVIATRSSVKKESKAKNVDILLPPEQLGRLLAESDFVVLAVPFTRETHNLIGEKELRSMKSTAYLINVSRGGVVAEDTLVRALDEKWIAGAGLDVFATEPLPQKSRLWELPNVIISPHISGIIESHDRMANDIFVRNLKRYMNNEKLVNVVDKKKGY